MRRDVRFPCKTDSNPGLLRHTSTKDQKFSIVVDVHRGRANREPAGRTDANDRITFKTMEAYATDAAHRIITRRASFNPLAISEITYKLR